MSAGRKGGELTGASRGRPSSYPSTESLSRFLAGSASPSREPRNQSPPTPHRRRAGWDRQALSSIIATPGIHRGASAVRGRNSLRRRHGEGPFGVMVAGVVESRSPFGMEIDEVALAKPNRAEGTNRNCPSLLAAACTLMALHRAFLHCAGKLLKIGPNEYEPVLRH